jgi:hypothetical protein
MYPHTASCNEHEDASKFGLYFCKKGWYSQVIARCGLFSKGNIACFVTLMLFEENPLTAAEHSQFL